ncbi:MAG TPA: F0F1 ATP synthase subunit delta [Verrucomicrobiae bacterium]|nr:F0F1 ATP synthase subunit delta [Verrucomicrobiae bacterium]
MKTPRVRIAATVANQTLTQGITQEYARELAAYLLSERRVGELESLLRDVQADWAANGYVEVLASSAYPLTDMVKRDIAARIKPLFPEADNIIVTEVQDPSVIGGVQIRLADRQLDLSVEGKLNTFKQLTGAGKD